MLVVVMNRPVLCCGMVVVVVVVEVMVVEVVVVEVVVEEGKVTLAM